MNDLVASVNVRLGYELIDGALTTDMVANTVAIANNVARWQHDLAQQYPKADVRVTLDLGRYTNHVIVDAYTQPAAFNARCAVEAYLNLNIVAFKEHVLEVAIQLPLAA